jgi:hypothetical protein
MALMETNKMTTELGFTNTNKQIVIISTGLPGTDYQQKVYGVKCKECGHIYGVNGSDIHDRLCPVCQGGKPGIGDWSVLGDIGIID